MMKKNSKITIFIFLFLIVSLFIPLFQMILQIKWQDVIPLFSSLAFKEALKNSVFVALIATTISIIIAYLLAYGLIRTNIKHKKFLILLITIPMLVPSISHGLGLITLFGNNGILTKYLHFKIIGLPGIVIGSILYSFPVAFLMIYDGFQYIDNTMYAVSKVLHLNQWQTFKKVTFPYMKKPIFSAIFAVFTLIFTDYGVPLAVGGKFLTLPVYLYKEVIGLLDFSTGTLIGLILLIPAFLSFLFDTFSRDYMSGNMENQVFELKKSKVKDILFKFFLFTIFFCVFMIIGSFIYYAFIDNIRLNPNFSLKHIQYVLSNDIIRSIINSLIVSLCVAVVGTCISFFTAYTTARLKSKISKLIHILSISSLAIPGIVLGLSYTITFSGTIIYNTLVILILVNIVHFMASPYLMAYNALGKINKNYEIVAKSCNISRFHLIKDIIIPCSKTTILEMLAYFFVNSMITISAIAFLFNVNTMPLSLLINTYEGNMLLGEAAIVSLIIIFFNIFAKLIVYFFNRREEKKYATHNESI